MNLIKILIFTFLLFAVEIKAQISKVNILENSKTKHQIIFYEDSSDSDLLLDKDKRETQAPSIISRIQHVLLKQTEPNQTIFLYEGIGSILDSNILKYYFKKTFLQLELATLNRNLSKMHGQPQMQNIDNRRDLFDGVIKILKRALKKEVNPEDLQILANANTAMPCIRADEGVDEEEAHISTELSFAKPQTHGVNLRQTIKDELESIITSLKLYLNELYKQSTLSIDIYNRLNEFLVNATKEIKVWHISPYVSIKALISSALFLSNTFVIIYTILEILKDIGKYENLERHIVIIRSKTAVQVKEFLQNYVDYQQIAQRKDMPIEYEDFDLIDPTDDLNLFDPEEDTFNAIDEKSKKAKRLRKSVRNAIPAFHEENEEWEDPIDIEDLNDLKSCESGSLEYSDESY